jgi:hypothetical protein
MRYLGRIAGEGELLQDGDVVARASYDLEGYIGRRGALVGSGEIEIPPTVAQSIFGARGLQLRRDDGGLLDLKFSGKEIPPATGAAQVEVSGDLASAPAEWGGRALGSTIAT